MPGATLIRAAPARGHGAFEFPRLGADPLRYLDRLRDDDRDVVPFRLGNVAGHLVKRPEDVETALEDTEYERDERWEPLLSDPVIPGIAVARARRRAASWVEGRPIEMFSELRRMCWCIDWEALTGEDLDERPELLRAQQRGVGARAARRRLDVAIDEMIADRRRRPHGDLLSRLADAEADDALVQEAFKKWLGADALHGVFTWALHLLAANPDVEKRWHAELDDVLADRQAVVDDIRSLPYTARIVKETLRLYPPVWGFFHPVTEDLELADAVIPAGEVILLSPWVTHRDPRLWPDPLRFDPDRWADAAERPPALSYFPFCAASHERDARALATKEAVLVLATLGQRWAFLHAGRHEPRPVATGTIAPRGGLRMIPVPRLAT